MAPPCNNQKPISHNSVSKIKDECTEELTSAESTDSTSHGKGTEGGVVTILPAQSLITERKTSGKIHGLIYCNCSSGYPLTYKRNKSNAETVSFPGPITLAGLPFAIGADDPFIMSVKLWHGSDELCRGYTKCWHPLIGWCMYNEVITNEVKGRNGTAVITYAVITNVVVASVEVIFIKGNRKAGARIYGTITASMSGWDVKRILFCKKRDKYIDVDSGAPIPLLRSVLLIPYTSSMHIDVDLSDAISHPFRLLKEL